MMLDLDILRIISNDVKPAIGKILISEPLMSDPFFSRGIVLIVDDFNDSYMGFVLNCKSTIHLHKAVHGFNKSDIILYLGGPVESEVLCYIHKFGFVSNAIQISENLYLNGDIEEVKSLVNSGTANNTNIKFFLGNSGWSPGQLVEEIDFNSWLVAEVPDDFPFSCADQMWKKSLDYVDNRYQIWKSFPIDPDLN